MHYLTFADNKVSLYKVSDTLSILKKIPSSFVRSESAATHNPQIK